MQLAGLGVRSREFACKIYNFAFQSATESNYFDLYAGAARAPSGAAFANIVQANTCRQQWIGGEIRPRPERSVAERNCVCIDCMSKSVASIYFLDFD